MYGTRAIYIENQAKEKRKVCYVRNQRRIYVCGGHPVHRRIVLMLERYVKLKIFSFVPAIVWIYVVCMILCTMGVFSSEEVSVTYSGLKNNLLYGMIFILMLRCDFRKLARLGPRMAAIFLGGSFTLGIGTLIGYPIFVGGMGGVEDTWAAVSALYASWWAAPAIWPPWPPPLSPP